MAERLLEPTGMTVDHLSVVEPETKIWSVNDVDSIELDLNGIPGDRHYGPTRTVRRFQSTELAGREVANDRQLIIAQASDMRVIAEGMALPIDKIEERGGKKIEHFMADQLAVNILATSPVERELGDTAISGLVLVLGNDPGTAACMKLSEYSRPCNQPVTQMVVALEALGLAPPMPRKELNEEFKRAARLGRGWLGSVFAPGTVAVGETISKYSSLLPRDST